MKKVLVATCVVAMTAFGITNASADPVASARANAYGVNVGGSLLSGLVEREPEVTSVLPPGGLKSEDIITVPADPVTINGTGVVVAETAADSTIVPFMGGEAGGTGGTTGDLTGGGGGLLGGVFDNLLSLGDAGGTTGGIVPSGVVGASAAGNEQQVQTQQVPEVPGTEGVLGGTLGGDLLGGLLDQSETGEVVGDDVIQIPVVNARGFARIDDLNILVENAADFGALPPELVAILVNALVEIDAVSAEAVAVCAQNQVFFDTASSVVALNDQNVDVVDTLLDTITEPILGLIPEDFLDIKRGEVIVGADGVAVNALHITLLGGTATGEIIPGTETLDPVTGEPVPGTGLPEVSPTSDALLDIVLGHAEVSSVACAPQAPPSTLVATGDPRPSLPRTGGLGVLPSVLGVGLLGG
ncbi:MAG: hypothetical protein KY458_14505, partial [Actinobacteria bacterium]|nr:hypothetical protein [Actinomycetota bacterium]